MINSVSSSSLDYQLNSVSSNTASTSSSALSLEQQQTIDDVLSEYDSSDLSQSDAQAIISAFSQAGIEPSKELEEAMDSLGFDAQEVGSLGGAGPQGGMAAGGMPPPPPPPPSSSEDSEEEFDTVSTLLDTLFESDSDDEEESSSTSFDDLLEYTSRIVNLNEESKNSVMGLLDQYSGEDNTLSSEQTSAVVKNALNSILSENNNYRHTSFYA